jgi:A/G-specific adenine glycosylase
MALAAGGGGRRAGRVRILANMRRASAWLGKVRIIATILSPRMSPVAKSLADVSAEIRAALLAWYDENARVLPWRARPGTRADPYRVWLSEIMLQQTTVAHATPYFLAFTRRWPAVSDLAAAPDAEVMAAWAGLGYYARARNLLACARVVAQAHGGEFPEDEASLRTLPGVGAYTAAAIAAIAFDRPATVVDGNVERVVARLNAVETPMPAGKAAIAALAGALSSPKRPADWAQAMMDLGSMICRPREPLCPRCPLAGFCLARASGDPAAFPRRPEAKTRPHRHGVAYRLTRDGAVGLVRRPPTGLLGGMLALPTTPWREAPWTAAEALARAPTDADWRAAGEVEHVFTHFSLTLAIYAAAADGPDAPLIWTPLDEAAAVTPSLFAKALRGVV